MLPEHTIFEMCLSSSKEGIPDIGLRTHIALSLPLTPERGRVLIRNNASEPSLKPRLTRRRVDVLPRQVSRTTPSRLSSESSSGRTAERGCPKADSGEIEVRDAMAPSQRTTMRLLSTANTPTENCVRDPISYVIFIQNNFLWKYYTVITFPSSSFMSLSSSPNFHGHGTLHSSPQESSE